MYWCTTNAWSIVQTRALRLAPLRSALGLWALEPLAQAPVVAPPQPDSAALAAAAAQQGKKVQLFAQPPLSRAAVPAASHKLAGQKKKAGRRRGRGNAQQGR